MNEALDHDSVKRERFPWYELASGDDLEQGDIFEACPIFSVALPFSYEEFRSGNYDAPFDITDRDVVVITQSCDLVKDRLKVDDLLLCQIWDLEELAEKENYLRQPKAREEIRRGNIPGYHMLNASNVPSFERAFRVVDFHQVFSLPVDFLREFAKKTAPRLRLQPPYREHLGQAFARYFMRVGLPVDIPAFKK